MLSQKTFRNFFKSAFSGKNKYVAVGLIIAAFITYLLIGPLNLLSVMGSYSNAYEGAKPSFYGVIYNGKKYTSNTNNPYYLNTGMGFSFKGDGPSSQYRGLPKVVGEMTPVFIPQNTKPGDLPSTFDVGGVKIPNPFTSSFGLVNNPYKTYSWNITSGNTRTLYMMEEWKTKWYVSISANPDGGSVPFVNSEWDQANGRYSDVQIWLKLDTTPTWYFQGQDQAYFAIAQVQLSGISYKGHDPDGNVQASHNEQNIIVNPSSPSSALTCYLSPFGSNQAPTPSQIYSYQGRQLNPQYFGNAVYVCITLNSFGSQSWFDWVTFKSQGDVVSFDFTVTQFVVGKWVVQNLQDIPKDYGRQSSYSEYGFSGVTDFLNSIGSNPLYLLIILGIIIIVIAAILIFFFPAAVKIINSGLGAAHKGVKGAAKRVKRSRKRSRKKG